MSGKTQKRLQLPEEILKHILLLLAMTTNGAKDMARVLMVSKGLKQLAMSADILKVISFGKAPLTSDHESFWNENGLIIQSARARNPKTYKEIMKRIKKKIDSAYNSMDFAIPLLEECNAKVEGGVSASSMTKEIRSVNAQVRRPMLRTNLDIMRAEQMISAFGKQYFRKQGLLVRFECIRPKFDKCCTIYHLLEEYAGVQQEESQ